MPTYYDDVIYIEYVSRYVWYVYGLSIHIVIWHTTAKNLPLKNLFVTSLLVHINGIVVASLYTSVEQIKFVFLALKRKLFCRLKKKTNEKSEINFFVFFFDIINLCSIESIFILFGNEICCWNLLGDGVWILLVWDVIESALTWDCANASQSITANCTIVSYRSTSILFIRLTRNAWILCILLE